MSGFLHYGVLWADDGSVNVHTTAFKLNPVYGILTDYHAWDLKMAVSAERVFLAAVFDYGKLLLLEFDAQKMREAGNFD